MNNISEIFNKEKPVIGMVHTPALPGTPGNKFKVNDILDICLNEADKLISGGVDSIMIENMHDLPYLKRIVGPEIVSSLSIISSELKNKFKLPMGIQVLAGANKQALAIAHAADLDFIRTEGYVFAHVADEGIMESDAAELLRYRKQIGAERIFIFTDIKKKHSSHSLTSDVNVTDTALTAQFFRSDGVIITGKTTGECPDTGDFKEISAKLNIPILIGSGINLENIELFFHKADAFIVGSWFKRDGFWENEVEKERVIQFMEKLRKLRN